VNSLPLNIQKYRMKLKSGAESRRLFYVAVTRARDHLVLSGSLPNKLPETDQGCSRRIEWIFFNIFSGDNANTSSGVHKITDGDYSCTIRVIGDRSEIAAEKVDCKRDPVPLPDCRLCVVDSGNSPEGRDSAGYDYSGRGKAAEFFSSTMVERYLVTGSTDILKRSLSSVIAGNSGSGASLSSGDPGRGSIIHRIMAGDMDIESPDIPAELRAGYRDMYQKFISSEFMQDVSDDYTELPFSMFFEGYPFRGHIDRLIRKGDGWYVLDFKTGNPSEKYSHDVQMVLYKMAAEKITGESVRTYLYYTENGEFREIIPDTEAVLAEIRLACEEISGKKGM
jgi:CRISPR/Cas system-associated exonuclease Cas4 (RecB family)